MKQIFRGAVSPLLSVVLIGAAMMSPVSGQDRPGVSRIAAPGPGLAREVLRDDAVRKELGLTDDQAERLRTISEETDFYGRIGPVFQKMRSAETDDERLKAREELRVISEAISLEQEAKARQVLDETQFRRARQISLQRQGVRALTRPDVARDLELSQTQSDELKALSADFSAGIQNPFASASAEGQEARKNFEARMLGVLTDAQKAKWTETLGPPGPPDRTPVFGSSGFNPASSRGGPEGLSSSARRGTGSQAAANEPPLPSSYGMIDEDSISGRIQFVAVTEVQAARWRTVPLNRDQAQLLTNLQTRLQADRRLGGLRQRLSEARTFDDCAAIRSESCRLLEQWNTEIEQELRMIVGEAAFEQLRPAILKRQGLWALTRPDVAADLKLSTDQSDRLKGILNDYRAAAAAAPMEASRLERSRLAAQFEQQMLQVLTAEQQTRWKAETAGQHAADGPRPR